MSHTPGPWEWQTSSLLSHAEQPYETVPNFAKCDEPDEDDANLIAAAPDLLEAMPTMPHPSGKLLKVVAHYEGGATQTIDGEVVTRAILKARGVV